MRNLNGMLGESVERTPGRAGMGRIAAGQFLGRGRPPLSPAGRRARRSREPRSPCRHRPPPETLTGVPARTLARTASQLSAPPGAREGRLAAQQHVKITNSGGQPYRLRDGRSSAQATL